MREARAEKDDSNDYRNQRQSRQRCGRGRVRRAGEDHLEEGCQQEEGRAQSQKAGKGAKTKAGAPKKEVKDARPRKDATEGRSYKKADVIAMVKRAKGVTLAEIMETTGWQPHTVRGFVSILGSKGGEKIESSKNAAGERSYHIAK